MNESLRAALAYADRGWAVFPVRIWQDSSGKAVKQPLTAHGFKDATTSSDLISRWWSDDVADLRGIGIATGAVSGIAVLDVDPIHQGDAALNKLTSEYGSLPDTALARSGSGGWHYYFAYPGYSVRSSAGQLGDGGLDIRADGGYIVAPPSPHPAGKYYWERTVRVSGLAGFPGWLAELNGKKKTKVELARTEGSRNVTLTSIGGTLRNLGMGSDQIFASLIQINNGLSEEEIRGIAESVSRYDPKGYPRTESGQAELFVGLNRGKFVFDGRTWLVWKGHWWDEEQAEPELYEKAVEAARYRGTVDNADEQKFGSSMESAAHLSAVLDLSSKKLTVDPSKFDSNPLQLGVENGVVDLRTGTISGGSPDSYNSRHVGLHYSGDVSGTLAGASRWTRFIREIFAEDEELIDYVWRAVGYSFTGLTREQCWFLCYGRGANGKSTFLDTLRSIAGSYGHTAKVSTFTLQRSRGDADEDVANLRGKRFVISGEANHQAELDQERIKALIGSESVRTRFLYSNSFEFSPTFKLWVANNQRPRVTDDAIGFWRRVRLIPFEKQFSPRDDPDLRETLLGERPGILAWIVAGVRAYLDRGLESPDKIKAVTEEYREENDHLGHFIREALAQEEASTLTPREVYLAYKRWALETGYAQNRIWAPHIFDRSFSTRFDKVREGERIYYRGLMVRSEEEEPGLGY